MADEGEHEYLTARELASLLRVRERKVYELAAAGDVPCSRATGKLLFRRAAVDAWLARSSSGPALATPSARPNVVGGSHDPLLAWALGESEAGLASLFDGSLDGLERFAARELVASALHVPVAPGGVDRAPEAGTADGARARTGDGDGIDLSPDAFAWNVPLVRARFGGEAVALIAFARRERGLVVPAERVPRFRGIADLVGCRLVPRQAGAGSQVLLERLLERAALPADAVETTAAARTESDAALAVAEGRADVAFGLSAPARQLGLGFVPIVTERFDLLVDRRGWFEPPLQRFAAFCRSVAFREKAASLGGYDIADVGTVRFNGEG